MVINVFAQQHSQHEEKKETTDASPTRLITIPPVQYCEAPRDTEMRRSINRRALGLEIGALHNPICPRADGFRCLKLDAFTREELLVKYADDVIVSRQASKIEAVDIVTRGPILDAFSDYIRRASTGESKAPQWFQPNGTPCLDYIISSHNFEHLPNPVKFLCDCEALLNAQGILVMAIPISTRCFDIFRPLTTPGQLLDAYLHTKQTPSTGNIHDQRRFRSVLPGDSPITTTTMDYGQLSARFSDAPAQQQYAQARDSHQRQYIDVHASTFNPPSFRFLIAELRAAGLLTAMAIDDIMENGHEFIVRMRKCNHRVNSLLSVKERTDLLKEIQQFYVADLLRAGLAIQP